VDLPDFRMHLAEAGQGEPLLLLHGWPQHWYCWREVVPALSGQFRLLMPDLRGFGWSDAPGHGYDAPTFAADIVALLDALNLDRVKLVGHDWGGFTAFMLGLEYPERFERIVVFNAPHPWAPLSRHTIPRLWRSWYAVLNATPALGKYVVSRRGYMPWFLGLGGRRHLWPGDVAATYAERLAQPARQHATAALYRYYVRVVTQILVARRFERQRLTVPTRLVFGADDFYVPPASLAGGERHGDDFQIELVPGCGHYMPEECPDVVVDRVQKFFAE
jgi:pimeloyl-ACP methyl ester carboxylesterase